MQIIGNMEIEDSNSYKNKDAKEVWSYKYMVSGSDITITIYEDRLFAKPFIYYLSWGFMLLNPHVK